MTERLRIPFNRTSLAGDELRYIADAVERGHVSGDGDYTVRCSEIKPLIPRMSNYTGCLRKIITLFKTGLGVGKELLLRTMSLLIVLNARYGVKLLPRNLNQNT